MIEKYKVVAEDFNLFLDWVKPSGEPFTLYGNSFLMTALTLWLIEGEGPYALFTQGDDVDLNQANMKFHKSRLDQLALYCSFTMSVEWGMYAAFCGFVFIYGMLVPNIRRKLNKVIGMSCPTVEHFQTVQIAIRDWVDSVRRSMSYADIIRANADVYGVTEQTAQGWFDVISSIGHISAEQYREVAHKVELNVLFLNAQGDLVPVY